jgi:AcrR family transcriptional regulator
MDASIKKRILDAARKLFAQSGLTKTSVDQIAHMAGIGKGTIYNYFDSKEEVFSEVVHEEAMILFATIDRAVHEVRGTREKLKTLAMTEVQELKKLVNLHSITKERFVDIPAELQHEMQGLAERERLIVADILAEGQRRGEVVIPDVNSAAFAVAASFAGLNTLLVFDLDMDKVEKTLDDMLNAMFNGFAPR